MTTLFYPFGSNFDGDGVPRAGGTISFFQTGTSTPQNTFTDSTLATPNANPVVADSNGLFPPIYLSASFDYKAILKDSSGVTIATRDPLGYTPSTSPTPPRSYLAGLTLSTAGGSSTFSVAAGAAADTTNASAMTLAASITKTTTAWVVGSGSGGLDTGAIANTTWYHVYVIQRTDTGVVDVLFSLSATTPTMPANYTLFRRIGAIRTDGSAHWIAFVQDGDWFAWVTLVADISSTNPGIAAVTRTLTVPTGVNVQAIIQGIPSANTSVGNVGAYFSDLATTDSAPIAATLADTAAVNSGVNSAAAARLYIRTNTSAQIRSRLSVSDAGTLLTINTLGWVDSRGRNA
jgi:hypothetical protein